MRLALPILLALSLAAHAQTTRYVSPSGLHETPFLTWATAATNIQAAIDAADADDTVRIAPGTYVGGTFIITNSYITVQGGNGTLWDADRTVIRSHDPTDGWQDAKVHSCTGVVVRGLTFTGMAKGFGVGVKSPFVSGPAKDVIIESCIFRNIGGLPFQVRYAATVGTEINNCIVVGGRSDGIYIASGAEATIRNCVVESSGGTQIRIESSPVRVQNTIHGNASGITSLGGNVTNNTTNSVLRLLDIAPASEGVGTDLVWAGVAAYIPRLASLAQGAGVSYAGIDTAKSGDGGPALWPIGAEFLGRDYSTNANHGRIIGGVTASTNSPFAGGGSAAFDGASGCVAVSGEINRQLRDAGAVTLEAWAFRRSTGVAYILGTQITNTSANVGQAILNADGDVVFSSRSTPAESSKALTVSSGSPLNEWVHCAGVFDYAAGKIVAYIDGLPVATQAVSYAAAAYKGDLLATGHALGRGLFTPQYYFNGDLAEVRIWSVARTPAEIAASYTNRLAGTEAGLVGYWRLDERDTPITAGPFNLRNPTLQPAFMEAF